MIIIAGPTAVGKSDVGQALASNINGEIINADVGQLYTPLSIGTAKPDWKNSSIPHHLFDVLDKPVDFTVTQYRELLLKTVHDVCNRNRVPIIVGGSHFYLLSLFFPPQVVVTHAKPTQPLPDGPDELWKLLYSIDPERAKEIHPHDVYRINRALAIWYETGKKPSEYAPVYNPPMSYTFITCTRERSELYKRINTRTQEMIENGWIEEVARLIGTAWQPFLLRKKIIGYDDILLYLQKDLDITKQELIECIAQKTRNYAKRQLIFLKMLQKRLKQQSIEQPQPEGRVIEVNLTDLDVDLYIKRLISKD